MKKKIWLISLIVVLIAVAITYWFMSRNNFSEYEGEFEEEGIIVQKAQQRELGETILVTGKVIPEEEEKIFLEPENGEVIDYAVEENDVVSAGDPLFYYDASKIESEYNQAVRERDLKKKRLAIEEKEMADLKKQITDVRKIVHAGGEFTKEDLRALEKEQIELEMALESSKSDMTSTQEQINELAATKNSMTVTSKINGIVVKVNKNIEKTEMGSSEPVIHIISSEPYKVIGTMSEFDTVKIEEGQEVIIRPKVYKDREWNGVVDSVSQFPDGDDGGEFGYDGGGGGNVTMYPFKVAITDDTSELRQGFHVTMEIKLSGNETFLSVPHTAIMYDEEGLEYVLILEGEMLQKRLVTTGEMNDEFLSITEGVANDELVVINPHEGMYDGMEVISYDEVE